MSDNMEIKAKIHSLEKLTPLGGFIGKVTTREINNAVCEMYDCSPFVLRQAMKESKDMLGMRLLLSELEHEFVGAAIHGIMFSHLGSVERLKHVSKKNEFESWFVEAELRLLSEDKYAGEVLTGISCEYNYRVMNIVQRLSLIEKKALFYRYDKKGKIVKSAEDIAKMPLFNCKPYYMEVLFNGIDERIKEFKEEEMKQFFDFVTKDFEELAASIPCESEEEDSECMLSQDEILWLLDSADATDGDDE